LLTPRKVNTKLNIVKIHRLIKYQYPTIYIILKFFKEIFSELKNKTKNFATITKNYESILQDKRPRNILLCKQLKKVFYLSPTSNTPIGGIRVFYLHAEVLTKNKIPAFVVHSSDWFKCNWFNSNAYTVSFFKMLRYFSKKQDLLVIPEIWIKDVKLFTDIKNIIIFVQNYGFLDIKSAIKYKKKVKFITCGQFITNKLKDDLNIDSKIIYTPVGKMFMPNKMIRNKKRIMYLARKHINDALYIKNKIFNEFPEYEFIGVKKIPKREDLVKEYQKSNIFLALSYPEGFPFPPIEAMACGCLVVGYTGGGGNEFMVDNETAFVAKDGNADELYKKLKKAITLSDNESEKIRQNAVKKAKEYDYEKFLFTLNLVYKFKVGNIE